MICALVILVFYVVGGIIYYNDKKMKWLWKWWRPTETGKRFGHLVVWSLVGIGFLWLCNWINDSSPCFPFRDKDGDIDIRFELLILGLPTATALWVFRNDDKITDHGNADRNHRDAADSRNQTLDALKRDEFYRLIQIQRDGIDNLLSSNINYLYDDGKSSPQHKIDSFINIFNSVDVNLMSIEGCSVSRSFTYKELSLKINDFGRTLIGYENLIGDKRFSDSYKQLYISYVFNDKKDNKDNIGPMELDLEVREFYERGAHINERREKSNHVSINS